MELHGSEKRMPPSLEQHVNVSAIKTGNVVFFGHSKGVKVIGGKCEDLDEARIQVSSRTRSYLGYGSLRFQNELGREFMVC